MVTTTENKLYDCNNCGTINGILVTHKIKDDLNFIEVKKCSCCKHQYYFKQLSDLQKSKETKIMLSLIDSINRIKECNNKSLEEVVKEFEEYTGQKVPQKAIDDFKFSGLNNIDFLTSSYLNDSGLTNILQYKK